MECILLVENGLGKGETGRSLNKSELLIMLMSRVGHKRLFPFSKMFCEIFAKLIGLAGLSIMVSLFQNRYQILVSTSRY